MCYSYSFYLFTFLSHWQVNKWHSKHSNNISYLTSWIDALINLQSTLIILIQTFLSSIACCFLKPALFEAFFSPRADKGSCNNIHKHLIYSTDSNLLEMLRYRHKIFFLQVWYQKCLLLSCIFVSKKEKGKKYLSNYDSPWNFSTFLMEDRNNLSSLKRVVLSFFLWAEWISSTKVFIEESKTNIFERNSFHEMLFWFIILVLLVVILYVQKWQLSESNLCSKVRL